MNDTPLFALMDFTHAVALGKSKMWVSVVLVCLLLALVAYQKLLPRGARKVLANCVSGLLAASRSNLGAAECTRRPQWHDSYQSRREWRVQCPWRSWEVCS